MISDFDRIDIVYTVRKDESVNKLLAEDPKSEIVVSYLSKEDYSKILKQYPSLFSTSDAFIYSVNVISSQMRKNGSYKKIRFYISLDLKILKKIES